MNLTINDTTVQVVSSSRRKTVSIEVKQGNVSIVVPSILSESRIKQILTRKLPWIKKKIAEYENREPIKVREYVTGELYDYLGESLKLKVEISKKHSIEKVDGTLLVSLPKGQAFPENIKNILSNWYHNQAIVVFAEKVSYFSKRVGVQPTSIEVKKYKARWGSCTIHAKVQFNWKLIMAPHDIVDYVVVHELCHILEHNHSSDFWLHVERVFPQYRECRKWLKDNGHLLEV